MRRWFGLAWTLAILFTASAVFAETYDGRRLYVTNSLISSIDFSPRYALRLIRMGPDGRMKLDPFFAIDFSRAPGGPARPHDMLLT